MLFDSLHLLGVLLGNIIVSQQLPVAQTQNTFGSRWAVPRMADNCTLPRSSGTSSLPNQVSAPFAMLPKAPITMYRYYHDFRGSMNLCNFKCQLLAPFNLLLFSSGNVLVRWHSYVIKCLYALEKYLANHASALCLCRYSCPRQSSLLHFLRLARVDGHTTCE